MCNLFFLLIDLSKHMTFKMYLVKIEKKITIQKISKNSNCTNHIQVVIVKKCIILYLKKKT